jgi:hypothetical protein
MELVYYHYYSRFLPHPYFLFDVPILFTIVMYYGRVREIIGVPPYNPLDFIMDLIFLLNFLMILINQLKILSHFAL